MKLFCLLFAVLLAAMFTLGCSDNSHSLGPEPPDPPVEPGQPFLVASINSEGFKPGRVSDEAHEVIIVFVQNVGDVPATDVWTKVQKYAPNKLAADVSGADVSGDELEPFITNMIEVGNSAIGLYDSTIPGLDYEDGSATISRNGAEPVPIGDTIMTSGVDVGTLDTMENVTIRFRLKTRSH